MYCLCYIVDIPVDTGIHIVPEGSHRNCKIQTQLFLQTKPPIDNHTAFCEVFRITGGAAFMQLIEVNYANQR